MAALAMAQLLSPYLNTLQLLPYVCVMAFIELVSPKDLDDLFIIFTNLALATLISPL